MLLYIHIPFCDTKCPYCAFGSVTGQHKLHDDYFNALACDLNSQILKFKNLKIKSVFIGGGTPSAVNAKHYDEIFKIFKPFLNKNAEITCEANPNSADLKWLSKMRNLGVNRISFGTQSFFKDKLKLLGRTHLASDTFMAVKNAKKAGFKNINVDLIYSTKLDTKKRLREEIAQISKLKINHCSAYALTLEQDTPFEKKYEYKKDSAILAKFLINELKNAGFKQYEISNFGKPCKHNMGYWKGDEYIGAGAYSVGFYNSQRLYSIKNLKEYIKNPCKKEIEALSKDDLRLEHIFLGLRSTIGVTKTTLNNDEKAKAEILVKSKKLDYKNGKFYTRNFLLADELALFITQN
ncbi:Heme chaperone HemW [Campylobacter majalis]|uniref:Heme chaperone HemW n=1 Tax=Campylobacter majalis TaxID=2790656 RepID=A0ABM8Q1W7_9BACT|nr:radical SAM family heme chaperone HemW [Campylobacter majalis]CAD7286796.1 Heme chaperone HemW [Campylobacter majalis]